MQALELIANHEKESTQRLEKRFMAVLNCGYPESEQNKTALAICRLFSKQAGFTWAGGLAMGEGGIIEGQPLKKLGFRVRNQKRALEITANALAKGQVIPEKAVVLMSKPGIPKWLYRMFANRSWKQVVKKSKN